MFASGGVASYRPDGSGTVVKSTTRCELAAHRQGGSRCPRYYYGDVSINFMPIFQKKAVASG
jgi:hypothetical protein